jgi:hypothetical protein
MEHAMSDTLRNELIDRIVSGEAGAVGFREFESIAGRQPLAWEQLARALRDEVQMRSAMQAECHAASAEAEIALAAAVASGDARKAVEVETMAVEAGHRAGHARRVMASSSAGAGSASPRVWAGWAAAAVVALAWTLFAILPQQPPPTAEPLADAPPSGTGSMQFVSLTADDAFAQYLELGQHEGRIIGELPARMIETLVAEDGGFVVYYVRQLLEREHVDEVYQYAEDELGLPSPIPMDRSAFFTTDSSL